jgi:hypothetical protein
LGFERDRAAVREGRTRDGIHLDVEEAESDDDSSATRLERILIESP